MTFASTGTCSVSGIIETNAATSWTGSSGRVDLVGGEIRGGFTSDVPIVGYGTIATDYQGGLVQDGALVAIGGVLEIAPGATVTVSAPSVDVESGAELYVHDAILRSATTMPINVADDAALRLQDAVLDTVSVEDYVTVNLGGGVGSMAPGGPGPVSAGDPLLTGAQLIATGDNEVAGNLDVYEGSEADILAGETEVFGLYNGGDVWVAPGADLTVDDELYGGSLYFANDGDIEVAGILDVALYEGYTGTNDGWIEVVDQGVAYLSGVLSGFGHLIAADGGTLHAEGLSYIGGLATSIILDGGTLEGALYTTHTIHGYGTITGSHVSEGGGIEADTFGHMLLIENAYIQMAGEPGWGDLVASNGAMLKIEDSGIMAAMPVMVMTSGGAPAPAPAGSGFVGPEFWVRGPYGGMPPPGGEGDLTIAFLRDSTVLLPAHVDAGGMMVTFGAVELGSVDVHAGGQMNVNGSTSLTALGVGIMSPVTEGTGDGQVTIAPDAKLTLTSLTLVAGAEPAEVAVQGELHFRTGPGEGGEPDVPCTIEGDGLVALQGGLISGEALVTHASGAESICGHGRIAAAMLNQGHIAANTDGGWLRLDTNDKVNEGLIEATNSGHIALDEIRLDNYGSVTVGDFSTLLVDASILDCKAAGMVTVGPDAVVELRRGGAIVGCGLGPMTTAVGSEVLVGAVGQDADPDVSYNEFALPGMDHAGTLTVFNPSAGGQAAPDTGDTLLTVGGPFTTSGAVNVGDDTTVVLQGAYTQSAGVTAVDGLMVAEADRLRFNGGTLGVNTASGGTIDLTTGNLVVDYEPGSSPYDQIEEWVTQGSSLDGSGVNHWNSGGTAVGITTANGNDIDYALAIVDTNDPDAIKSANPGFLPADLEGEPFDDTSVLVKYTFYADANLDGVLTSTDITRLVTAFSNGLVDNTPRWIAADFNYDDARTSTDITLLVTAFSNHAGETLAGGDPMPLGGGMPATTPEPATLALAALGVAAMLARQRKTRRS